jgi:hypothetical protein
MIPNKKTIAVKRIRTKLDRLKNHRGWNLKSFVIW